MSQTLWELAQEMRGSCNRYGKLQCAGMVEQWAREKASLIRDSERVGVSAVTITSVLADLGVPEEDNG